MKIAMVEQDILQQESVRRLGTANSTVSDIIYDRNQCERTKEHIAETLGIERQYLMKESLESNSSKQ